MIEEENALPKILDTFENVLKAVISTRKADNMKKIKRKSFVPKLEQDAAEWDKQVEKLKRIQKELGNEE